MWRSYQKVYQEIHIEYCVATKFSHGFNVRLSYRNLSSSLNSNSSHYTSSYYYFPILLHNVVISNMVSDTSIVIVNSH